MTVDGRRKGRRRQGYERFPSRYRNELVVYAHACCGGRVIHEKKRGNVYRCRKCGEVVV